MRLQAFAGVVDGGRARGTLKVDTRKPVHLYIKEFGHVEGKVGLKARSGNPFSEFVHGASGCTAARIGAVITARVVKLAPLARG
jgi:hypothetical protein